MKYAVLALSLLIGPLCSAQFETVTFEAKDCESGCQTCRPFGVFGLGGQQCAGARGEEGVCDCKTTLFTYPFQPSLYTCEPKGDPCFGIVVVGGCDYGTSSLHGQEGDGTEIDSSSQQVPGVPDGYTIER